MKKIIVIGGGAAGMMAAITAAGNNNKVVLVEKNEKLGKKIFITGKGRCNFTNAGDSDDLMNSIVTNKKFMYSSLNKFSNYDAMGFFGELGLDFKVERGDRVFPTSDHSSDVISALNREMKKRGVEIRLNTKAVNINTSPVSQENDDDNNDKRKIKFESLTVENETGKKEVITGDELIIATGGNSYQSTGSTGDGYKFAKSLGHTVTPILPALVPFNVKEEWERELQGLSLKNVNVRILDGEKEVYSDFGEMLFTHFGVSGPVIISASSYINRRDLSKIKFSLDLKPAITEKQLDDRILRDFEKFKNKSLKNSLEDLLLKGLIPVILNAAKIDGEKKNNELTAIERKRLVETIKSFYFYPASLRDISEAIVTAGGVSVKEINSKTMESKLVKGLFFAGEVLDLDALTGGFNITIAATTAYAAGNAE